MGPFSQRPFRLGRRRNAMMLSRAGAVDAGLVPASQAGRLPVWSLVLLRRSVPYLLNTLGVMVVAGLLFAIQPFLLSSPFDGVFTYLNMVQTYQWQVPGEPLGGYNPLEGMGSRLMPIVPVLLPHTYAVWLSGDPVTRVWLGYMLLTGMLAVCSLAYYRAVGVPCGLSIAATWLLFVLALTQSDLARSAWDVVYGQAGMLSGLVFFLRAAEGHSPAVCSGSSALSALQLCTCCPITSSTAC